MEDKEKDTYTTYVMIKIIEAVEREAENGVYHSYSPNNIYLHNFNVKNLEQLTVKFGAHIINKNNKNDGLYLAPEVLGGSVPTKKSVVFCLGVILDELIHGAPFFKSIEDIQNMHSRFSFILSLVQSTRIKAQSYPEEHFVWNDEQGAKQAIGDDWGKETTFPTKIHHIVEQKFSDDPSKSDLQSERRVNDDS